MTVFTCVCWSMISETQIAYGSIVCRQGRLRALRANQFKSERTRASSLCTEERYSNEAAREEGIIQRQMAHGKSACSFACTEHFRSIRILSLPHRQHAPFGNFSLGKRVFPCNRIRVA